MLNREGVIAQLTFLKSLGILNAVTTAGAALVLMGLREETVDVDVAVDWRAFMHASNYSDPFWHKGVKCWIINIDKCDIHLDHVAVWRPLVTLDDQLLASPMDILAMKRSMNRPKDQGDIVALEAYIAKFPVVTVDDRRV